MRLKSVYISQYKNLRDYALKFDGNSFIDVFVGKNATGKSNLFEALIEIFRHIVEFDLEKAEFVFNYRLNYEINGREIDIAWKDGTFWINGRKRKTIGQTPLPENVLIYYSGYNETVAGLVEKYEASFGRRIKRADLDESRYFLGIGPQYKG
jgi:AAA ATPase domain